MTSISQYSETRRNGLAGLLSASWGRCGWLRLIVLTLALPLAGCGGDGLEPSDRAPATPPGIAPIDAGGEAAAPAASSEAGAPAGPEMMAAVPAEPGMPGPSEQAQPKAAEKPADPLPENVADWKKDDYLRAKKSRDKRLAEAVMYLGEHFAGTPQADSAAMLLATLLQREKVEEKSSQNAPGSQPPVPSADPAMSEMSPSVDGGMEPGMAPGMDYGAGQPHGSLDHAVIKAIVYALGATRSKAGRNILKQVLAGTYEVENDRAATTAALESLAFYSSAENEAILLEVLTTPEKVRKPQEEPKAKTPEGQPSPSQPQPARPPGFEAPDAAMNTPESSAGVSPEISEAAPDAMPGQEGAGAKMSPAEMQRLAIPLIRRSATEQLRTKVATILSNPSIPDAVRAQVGGFLLQRRPDNAPAQMIFYRSEVLDAQSKEALVGYFTGYSSDALGAILGIPPGVQVALPSRPYGPGMPDAGMMPGMEPGMPAESGMPGESALGGMPPGTAGPAPTFSGASPQPGAEMPGMEPAMPGMEPGIPGMEPGMPGMEPGMPGMADAGAGAGQKVVEIDAELGYRIASQLWHGDFARVVAERLDGVESLSTGAPRIVMAGTMPLDGMRAKLYEVLHKHHTQGPAAIESTGLLSSVIFEPGFLAVVKSLPREDVPVGRAPAAATQPPRRRPRPAAEGQPQGPAEPPEWQQKQLAAQAWMRTSEKLVRVLCGRLAAASEKGLDLGASPESQQPPLELPSDVQITAQYTLEWPTEAAKKMAGVPLDPMKIRYVRVEQTGNPKTVLGFYRRKMSSPVIHELGTDYWAESFRRIPKTDRKLSVDVLISSPQLAARAQAAMQPGAQPEAPQQPGFALGAAEPADAELDLVVEILALEIKDPMPPEKEE